MNISILPLIVKSSWKQPSHDLKKGLVLTPGLVMCAILFANNYPQENSNSCVGKPISAQSTICVYMHIQIYCSNKRFMESENE